MKSDNRLERTMTGEEKPFDPRLHKVDLSMRRLMGVLEERRRVRLAYKTHLENQYIDKKRQEEIEQLHQEDEHGVDVPEITFELLRDKYRDLRKGKDNLDYIKRALEYEKEKKDRKKMLNEKYHPRKKARQLGLEVTKRNSNSSSLTHLLQF